MLKLFPALAGACILFALLLFVAVNGMSKLLVRYRRNR